MAFEAHCTSSTVFVSVSGPSVKPDEEFTPAVSASVWNALSESVIELLEVPQDWEAMEAWIRQEKFAGHLFRHVLAWLEERRLARSFVSKERDPRTGEMREKLYWVNSRWLARISRRPAT